MEEFTTKHPADARPDELTHGQRVTRALMPELAALQDQRKCVMCQQPKTAADIATWSAAGQREWNISGACEPCFDGAFPEEVVPIFRATMELALRRSTEALALEAASTDRSYGDCCYFGGGRLDWTATAGPIVFTLDHGTSTTDEVSCQACFDRVLGAMVKASLDSAEANGYDLRAWDPGDVAADLHEYDGELDQMPPSFMLPFVERWMEEGQIAKAETGQDRGG
jgi:hypothetical protein